ADNRPEFFWNYLTKTMRLKLDKWTKMITTNEFRVSQTPEFLLNVISLFIFQIHISRREIRERTLLLIFFRKLSE
ncbi:GM12959, partial [Drosophila sechellia]